MERPSIDLYQNMMVGGSGGDGDADDDHRYSLHQHHHHQSPVKKQLSFSSDTYAATTDESSQSSSSVASPASNYTDCVEVSSLSEQEDIRDCFHCPEVIVVGPSLKAHLDEISERAQHLLQREQAAEYKVENYFHRTKSSVDPNCRYMMMEWSFRIVESSFPPPLPDQAVRRRRKHSLEALQLTYAAFSYIDRISSCNDPDPAEFKLLSMVSLHIAAKISGFFGNSGQEANWSTRRHDDDDVERQLYFNPCQSQDLLPSPLTPCSTACVSDESDADASNTPSNGSEACEEVSGQTIFSTPGSSPSGISSSLSFNSEEDLKCKPRPSMELLSLPALCTLYGGDVHLDEMKNVERTVLQHGLKWKLTGVTVFEWLDVFLDLAKLRLPQAWANFFVDWDCIQERAWVLLESAIEHHCFMTSAPSVIGLAAFMNAIEEYNEEVLPGMSLLDQKMFEDVLGFSLERDELLEIRVALLEKQSDE